MALIMSLFFFLYTTPGRIPFTFRCRHGREVNTCILLYLLIFPFILQKARGREHGFIYYTSSFFPSITFLQLFPYLMPYFGVWGERMGWGTVIGMESVTFFLSFFCSFHGV